LSDTTNVSCYLRLRINWQLQVNRRHHKVKSQNRHSQIDKDTNTTRARDRHTCCIRSLACSTGSNHICAQCMCTLYKKLSIIMNMSIMISTRCACTAKGASTGVCNKRDIPKQCCRRGRFQSIQAHYLQRSVLPVTSCICGPRIH